LVPIDFHSVEKNTIEVNGDQKKYLLILKNVINRDINTGLEQVESE